MELSLDCIRDILLFAEELPYSESAMDKEIFDSKRLQKYEVDQINYAVSKLGDDDAQLIKGFVKFVSNKPYITCISSLTFNGHKYLDNIRDPKIWKESKKISSKVASVSIDIMSEIAAKVIAKTLGLD